MIVKFSLDKDAFAPEKAYPADAGWDLRTPKDFYLAHDQSITIDTGVHIELEKGHYGRIASKSGLNRDWGIVSEGVVDAGYSGSICVTLHNLGNFSKEFKRGDKITQLIIEQIPHVVMCMVDEVKGGARQDNGFGSTGR